MRVRSLALLCAALTAGCATPTGTWTGECDAGEVEVLIDLTLTEDGESISGDGVISYQIPQEDPVEDPVTVTGDIDGTSVLLELTPETGGELSIDGELDGDVISGDCSWLVDGSAKLERVE